MKLAFCLFKYFPFGGLQRDFLRIAKECLRRGHTVDIFTMSWEGDREGLTIHIIPSKGLQNHTRAQHFVTEVQAQLAKYDLVIGFNKMPGLDIYYAADTCYQAKAASKNFLYHLTPRYRHLLHYEKAVFTAANTHVLTISKMQQDEFMHYYKIPPSRLHFLPPGIAKDRIAPMNAAEIRQQMRQTLNIKENEWILLLVGSGFKTKGLDRILLGVASLASDLKNRSHLYIIGKDNAKQFAAQAKKLGIAERVHFLGGRDDVPYFLMAADLLLHPAYNENTGTVLLEAVTAGLPVLTTDVCGYAEHIQQAKAGVVLPSPFQQEQFNQTLSEMLLSKQMPVWKQNAILYAKQADIYSLPERAVDKIEQLPLLGFPKKFADFMSLKGQVYRELEGRRTQRIVIDKPYFIKQHFGVGWKEIFKNLLQLRLPIVSAKNEWLALEKLEKLNIPAPDRVSYACKGYNPATRQSYLITKELPKHISLEDFCPPTFKIKQEIIKQVASIARSMHNNGMNHRDFYICHFLLDIDALNRSTIKLYLIDLHRAQLRKRTPLRWIIKDLAGLYFSSINSGLTKRDLLRFIIEYRNKPLREIYKQPFVFWDKVKKRGDKLCRKHEK